MKRYWSVFAVLLCGVLAGCSSTSQESSVTSPAVADLASCLTKNGAVFYGTEWCPHCKEQKRLFGNALSGVNYVDCDANKMACSNAWVQWYPTWVFADGSKLVWTQQLDALASKAGCTFAPEALVAEQQQQAVEQAAAASGKETAQ